MRRLSHLVAPALLLVAGAAHALPEGFAISDYASVPGGPQITAMAWAPDGSNRLFLTGKEGAVRIIKDGTLLAAPFIQLEPRTAGNPNGEVITNSECGLLSIAFDPDFVRNGYVYFFVTRYVMPGSNMMEQRILRYTAVGDTGTDRQTVIGGLATLGQNHDGGTLAFGPDGLLYWAIGDNGSMIGVGNDTLSSAAKVSRAPAVPNAPPVAGPYNDGSGPNFDYIFARGFRNPYTMTFEPESGSLWVNVVGTSWEQIFVVGLDDHAGYPMENRNLGTAGALNTVVPTLVYPTGSSPTRAVGAGGAVRAGGILTLTTADDHLMRVGNTAIVAGIDDTSMNGSFTITEIVSARVLRVANPGPDATSGNGTVAFDDYGNVLLGGAFYDGSQFPEEYRGDFFFGDFGTGQFQRLVVNGAGNGITRVERFETGVGNHIDTSTGPDGALYLVNHDGAVRRIVHDVTAQGIVVAPLHLQIVEGGRGVVTVSLAQQPAANVTLNVARASGDTDLSVMGGGALTFTTANWNVPQAVTLASVVDADGSADTAMFAVSGAGLADVAFRVRATDGTTGTPDAGVADAGVVRDAAVRDAAVTPTRDAAVDGDGGIITPMDRDDGCGCRTGSDASSGALAGLAILLIVAVRRRRS